ncbi:N-acetyltransferase [Kocuria tytonicola]|uniref:N-acetyltransferase n=1 Tax=Kocuria tytonicola TaxID=2055946 RepID=A0A3L9LV06_9MICC|nr:GNAT family N-acetyltransferase [Kocuria tytonicola]RLY94150.1 N-acetyltransferase [Kocuria tytonicola]RLZ02542.1 N-acetyltransferase [Kocuria tytonicola]
MIETSRLCLRPPRETDVAAVFAYRSRRDVAQYLSVGVWTREHTLGEMSRYAVARFDGPGDELVLLAEILETGEVAGEVGLTWLAGNATEIGYVFNPTHTGRGLATEAVAAVLDAARHEWGFVQVMAKTDRANTASRALCKRLGMTLVSTGTTADGREVAECTYVLPAADGSPSPR